MTGRRRHDHQVPPETRVVAERIPEDAECEACLASQPKDER